MKKTFLLAAAAAAALALPARADKTPFGEGERQAFAAAMADVASSLRGSTIPDGAGVSVLAVAGDRDAAVAGLLKIAVTDAGKTYVEGKNDPMWEEVVKEIEFDEVKGNAGLLDPKTLDKLGSLKASNILLYGAIRACSQTENRIFVELELHATDVKTKRHVWGGLFAKRWYVPGTEVPKGISELPTALRDQLKREATAKFVESLKAQPKLSAVKSVVLTPLAGDEDRYCTYIVRDGIVQTDLTAKELDLASLQGARTTFRDLPVVAGDTVIYGAVRQLGWYYEQGLFGLFEHYDVQIDFQAAIERNDTHDVLWSDTIQSFDDFYIWNWPKIILLAVGAVVVLLVIRAFLKAATRVR